MKQKKDFLQWKFTWKRWDLIPNIVQVVKRYAKLEKDTLKEIVELRNSVKSYDKLSDE